MIKHFKSPFQSFLSAFQCKSFKRDKKHSFLPFSIAFSVYIVHATFLSLFSLLFVHVQVSTRMILSATPVPYWIAALICTDAAEAKKRFTGSHTRRFEDLDREAHR